MRNPSLKPLHPSLLRSPFKARHAILPRVAPRAPKGLRRRLATPLISFISFVESLRLPYYKFKPNYDEVAIKGDSFTFTCGTTWISVLKINWYKDDQLLRPDALKPHMIIDFKADNKADRIISTLTLNKLDIKDTGVYKCTVFLYKS